MLTVCPSCSTAVPAGDRICRCGTQVGRGPRIGGQKSRLLRSLSGVLGVSLLGLFVLAILVMVYAAFVASGFL